MPLIIAVQLQHVSPQFVIDVLLSPIAVLGGGVTVCSGGLSAYGILSRAGARRISELVDIGIGVGFILVSPLAAFAFAAALVSSHG